MSVNDYALTTRARVQEYRVANGETLDSTPEINTQIDNLINSVSSRFESHCDRHFVSRAYTEYLDGKGSSVIYPKQYPITAVESTHSDSGCKWLVKDLINSDNYRVVDENSIVLKSGMMFPDAVQNIKLVYTAGYTDIPYDLENACINEVLRTLNTFEEIGVSEKRSNDFLIKYITNSFLDETATVLNRYRRKQVY